MEEIQTFIDLSQSQSKINDLSIFLNAIRDRSGGIIVAIIIPPALKEHMLNVLVEQEQEDEFYRYGWYNQFGYAIYIDKTLTDQGYLTCNGRTVKFKVKND